MIIMKMKNIITMDEYIENINNNKKLTKKEKFKEIMLKSKQFKEEKQRIKENTLNKIAFLNENFDEINSLLKKRKRTFNRLNDDYDRLTSNFIYSERTHPTERVKSKEEIEEEKEKKLKKMEMQRLKEEVDAEEEESGDDKNKDLNEKYLTKKERIDKLIQERLGKAKSKMDNIIKNKIINIKEDDENNDDSLSDLNEIEKGGEEEDDENDDEEEENNDGGDEEDNEEEEENNDGEDEEDNEEDEEDNEEDDDKKDNEKNDDNNDEDNEGDDEEDDEKDEN